MLSFKRRLYAITCHHRCAPDSTRHHSAALLFHELVSGSFLQLAVANPRVHFLPTTLLWYSAVHWFSGEWGIISIGGIVVALIVDLFPARKRRAVRATA